MIFRPTLEIGRSETGVEIFWPTNFPNYILETAFDLSAVWNIATNAPIISNGKYVVPLNGTAGNQFFRLRLE